MTSALSRSLKELRSRGAVGEKVYVAKVEHFNTFSKRRIDLFNIFDLLWLSTSTDDADWQIVGVQVVNTHLPEHIEKIKASPEAHIWIACGGGIVIHEWKKVGPRGKRKVWTLTEHEIAWERNEEGKVIPHDEKERETDPQAEVSSGNGGSEDRGIARGGGRLRRGSR